MQVNLLRGAANSLSQINYATYIASQNINNSDNKDYSRNIAHFSVNSSGITTVTSKKMSDIFLNTQLMEANSQKNMHSVMGSISGNIDTIITGLSANSEGEMVNGFSNSFNEIHDSIYSMIREDNYASRSTFLNKISVMTGVTNKMMEKLDSEVDQINSNINQSVSVINRLSKSLSDINKKIITNPSDDGLITQRDSILNSMSDLADIKVKYKDNGSVNVSIYNGSEIVSGSSNYKLTTSKDAGTGNSLVLLHGDSLSSASKIGGTIGGYIGMRDDLISDTKSEITKTTISYLNQINQINSGGFNKDGESGADIVTFPNQIAKTGPLNSGSGSINISVAKESPSNVTGNPFTLEKTDDGYLIKNSTTGEVTSTDTLPTVYEGFELVKTGTMEVGDTFSYNPSDMIDGIKISKDTDIIAAASEQPYKDGDKGNLSNFINIKEKAILSNGDSILDQVSNLFTDIGNRTNEYKVFAENASAMHETTRLNWESLSGVNNQEEEINLMKYQQIYMSVSKIVEADKKMFESIFSVI